MGCHTPSSLALPGRRLSRWLGRSSSRRRRRGLSGRRLAPPLGRVSRGGARPGRLSLIPSWIGRHLILLVLESPLLLGVPGTLVPAGPSLPCRSTSVWLWLLMTPPSVHVLIFPRTRRDGISSLGRWCGLRRPRRLRHGWWATRVRLRCRHRQCFFLGHFFGLTPDFFYGHLSDYSPLTIRIAL